MSTQAKPQPRPEARRLQNLCCNCGQFQAATRVGDTPICARCFNLLQRGEE